MHDDLVDLLLASDLDLSRPFTAAMADGAGISRRRRTAMVAAGILSRPLRGVLHASHLNDSLELRLACLELVVPPDAVVTDRTAAWLHGATAALAPGAHQETPPVSAFQPPGKRLRNGLTASGERGLLKRDVERIGSLHVTTQLRTACDVGRLLKRDSALAALDGLSALGVVTSEHIVEETARFRGYRGVRQLRALTPIIDPRSESFGESALRLRWYDAGVTVMPETQIEVWSDSGRYARLDLGSTEYRFAAEYDGEQFHGAVAQEHDRERRAWLAELGWTVVVCRRANVFGRHQDADLLIKRGFARARLKHRGSAQ